MIYKSYLLENDLRLIKANLVLFYGENLGLKNHFKKEIKLKNDKTFIINLNQDDILNNQQIIYNEILNISLFEEKKILFINQATDKILDLIKYIETKITDQKIYLFSEALNKKSKLRSYFEMSDKFASVPCYADNEITLKKILNKELKDFKNLTNENLNIIVNSCNLDRSKLDNEIKKIKSLFENKILDRGKLLSVLNLSVNEDFNILRDEALNGNKSRTNKLLSDTIIDQDKNILYLSAINQRLSKLFEIKENSKEYSSLESAINNIKPPIFWKDKTTVLIQATKWSSSKIKKGLLETYKFESKIKSDFSINHNIVLKKLIIDLCNIANA